VLLLQIGVQAAQGQDKNVISGRVVNAARRPVAHAIVTLHPTLRTNTGSAESVDGLLELYETDADGKFSIPSPSPTQQQAVLYVTTPVPPGAYAPLTAPFTDLTGASVLPGQPVVINKNGDTHVGDVPVNVRYAMATVYLQDAAGAPLLGRDGKRSPIRLRVRDARGSVVSEGDVPSRAIRDDDSSIVIAVPEGVWNFEVALGNRNARWHAADGAVNLRASGGGFRLTLKVPAGNGAEMPCTGLNIGNGVDPGHARQRLAELGVTHSEDSFVEHAEKGNPEAVSLLLATGMDSNVRDGRGNTALIAAAANGHADVVRVLLNGGANVNALGKGNETALVAAASFGNLCIVQALLDRGADPNVRTDGGLTALIVAAGNNHLKVVEALLAVGVDVSARSNEGMTALDFAVQSGNEKLIQLLKKAGSHNLASAPYQSPPATAEPTGLLAGTVADISEARVPGATVFVESEGATRTALTNEEGTYRIKLPFGIYRIRVESSGFCPSNRTPLRVQPDTTARINFTLIPCGVGNHLRIENGQYKGEIDRHEDPFKEEIFSPAHSANAPFDLLVRYGERRQEKNSIEYQGTAVSYNEYDATNPAGSVRRSTYQGVTVIYDALTIRADQVSLDPKTFRIKAKGNVIFEDGKRLTRAENAEVEFRADEPIVRLTP
jgi:hypothetical protein